jgi:4-aminobutyrate aminotransferase
LVPEIHHVSFPRHCPGCEPSDSPTADLRSPLERVDHELAVFRMPSSSARTSCRCVADIEDTLFRRVASPDEVAAIFVEPIQGEGGYYPSPMGFLTALRNLCDRHGIMLIADEVQSGMGRTGKMFAIEHWNVEPDVLCLAKGMASGLPLGAIVARAENMDWPPGSHASTFGGNPVACRASLATIDLLEREYMRNAEERGEELRQSLRKLRQKHGCLANVRGLGLMTAVDLVEIGPERVFDPSLRDRVVQAAFRHGLLLLGCGESALRFCPPLCITSAQVGQALEILDRVLAELTAPMTVEQ